MGDVKPQHIDLNTVGAALNKWIRPPMRDQKIPDFTVHDFRRTARMHLSALGISPYVAGRCLNHAVKGVEGIYNHHDFLTNARTPCRNGPICWSCASAAGRTLSNCDRRRLVDPPPDGIRKSRQRSH